MTSNSKITWMLLLAMFVIQLSVPLWMIKDKTNIRKTGKVYKFELEAIDPNDPFRGKYIILNPKEDKFKLPSLEALAPKMFATFISDSTGFAQLNTLNKKRPTDSDYLEVTVFNQGIQKATKAVLVTIRYPFDRYYMNERKAQGAEDLIQGLAQDSIQKCFAEVSILNGKSFLHSVKVDNLEIEQLISFE